MRGSDLVLMGWAALGLRLCPWATVGPSRWALPSALPLGPSWALALCERSRVARRLVAPARGSSTDKNQASFLPVLIVNGFRFQRASPEHCDPEVKVNEIERPPRSCNKFR